jgi:predicted ATP-binding protein involved in virulence
MRINTLKLVNIGPFKEANLDFISNQSDLEEPPVICITGENGTGKSIILDAIRAILNGRFTSPVERDIISSGTFEVESTIFLNNKEILLNSSSRFKEGENSLETTNMEVNRLFRSTLESHYKKDFILDYWASKLSDDKFAISNITTLNPNTYLDNVLSGVHKNLDLTKNISFFDYLKDSIDPEEKNLGETIYKILEEIINMSISFGKFSHVSRINLKPIIKIGKKEISLEKLSSGNLYLIQRLINLLSQVYSICILNNLPISEYKTIKGLLIIDEAENHLHPKWQKVFLQNILKIFPKLQIIISTHSPFIVASVPNSRVFVCSSKVDYSIVTEETDFYNNKPIEEILQSPLFNTRNFSQEISILLDSRKVAAEKKQTKKLKEIESKLLELNPEYFDYLNIDEILKSLKK